MRPLHGADLFDAMRAVLAVPAEARATRAAQVTRAARLADRYRKRLGRAHPRFGNGSLSDAARAFGLAKGPPRLGGKELAALLLVIEALVSQRWEGRRMSGNPDLGNRGGDAM